MRERVRGRLLGRAYGRVLATAFGATTALTAPIFTPTPTIAADPPIFLEQGWTKETRDLFYYTPQGSRVIPYAWFMALEVADGPGMFADTAHLQTYGFIPADGPHPLNPGMLPIGFAIDHAGAKPGAPSAGSAPDPVDPGKVGQYLGITCAACHTSNVTVAGRTIRIEGGASHLDFDRFYADLAAAVSRTVLDSAKFQRFAARVLGGLLPTEVADLRTKLAYFEVKLSGDAMIRAPALASGFGRVDALTQSINAIAVNDQGDPLNLRPVNAPTSFPSLWLAPDLEFVQWNPIAANPFGRNGGEVLGVFGSANLNGDPKGWFTSSLLVKEMAELEDWLTELKPPRWDESLLGRIDPTLARTGEGLFRRDCVACHNAPPYRRTDPAANLFQKTFIEIGRVDYRAAGTDPVYFESLLGRLVRTNAATALVHGGQSVVPAAVYFTNTTGAVITRAMADADLSDAQKAKLSGFRLRPPALPGGEPVPYAAPSLTDLKAGPLAGIWTSGPYLHNGSVPTIYELLSPVAERRAVFWTGGRELDRERLGFVSDDAPGRFRFDTALAGNRNIGHVYPPQGLTRDERMAVIEYLKTQ
jgi:mono/diheme cytochrome c family protein